MPDHEIKLQTALMIPSQVSVSARSGKIAADFLSGRFLGEPGGKRQRTHTAQAGSWRLRH